jgi:protein-S-isoprenylcysteine O-methyltransferase Ste14
MNPWYAKALVLLGALVMVAIRAPHGQRSRSVAVSRSRRGKLEGALLALAWVAFFVPLVWIASPLLAFADYPLRPPVFVLGALLLAFGLYLFYRSHADLGTNWSITLEIRERHTLVTDGIYRTIRHPMYLSLLVYGLGQALAVPNWVAGPSYLFAMSVLFALRVGAEERMMREEFGARYDVYAARTKRLVPRVW